MPWQRLVADVGGEFNPETGIPYYREIIWSVMRQTGKTTLVWAFENERACIWKAPQRIIYTAQTGAEARKKLLRDQLPTLRESKLWRQVKKTYEARGEEAVYYANGSILELEANTEKSGHGSSLDLGVIDESWADEDNRREQAMTPMMKTRPMAQILIPSTMGTAKSVYWDRKVEVGRHAAKEDKGRGIAYFEWSVPLDADIWDPEVWWTYMPALGWTQSEEVIAHAGEAMDEAEWRRADMNQSTEHESEQIIPQALWDAALDPTAFADRTRRAISFGLDVLPEREMAAIVASDGTAVEPIEHAEGTGWVVERAKSLTEKWGGEIVIDGGGPASSLADALEKAGVPVRRLTNAEVVAACARIYDDIADGKARVLPYVGLEDAVKGLAQRPLGDRFVWARRTSTADITPFFAATLAYATEPQRGGGELLVAIT